MAQDLLLSYYGDDFTGSTDVMEALSSGGIPTVLFTGLPDKQQISRFPNYKAVGIAGISRSQSPNWMDQNLPEIFQWLKDLKARHCHYKTCSTFDSSPGLGSIGRALEIALEVFEQEQAAMVIGAPQLRRYTYFGQLFASYRDKVYRIDRHPVMSKHPVTPMQESDLLVHLAQQTDLHSDCVNPEALAKNTLSNDIDDMFDTRARLILLDVFDTLSQQKAGAILDRYKSRLGPFVIGSSGIEYALLNAWKKNGLAGPVDQTAPIENLERIAVVSGSCSPTTERQIDTALKSGFTGIQVDYEALVSGQGREAAVETALRQASEVLDDGQSPILFTAKGSENLSAATTSTGDAAGQALGSILKTLVKRHSLDRVIVAGGDTSSHALSQMDVIALTLRQPIPGTPGSPLCNAHRNDGSIFELALKGGQIGGDDYFIRLRDGTLSD